jgi:mono/diheme cytochrome c family protein
MKGTVFTLLLLAVVVGILVGGYLVTTGLSARAQPARIETLAARTARTMAIRAHAGAVSNPVPASPEVIAEGLEHYADHCSVCHGNDGSGNTEMGRGLYPKAPDMRLPSTQNLSDAELFYIIENGVRFTGMPGWSTGTKDGETSSWHLVHFIRHLPRLTEEEVAHMQELTPQSPAQIRQQIEEEKFLRGDDLTATPVTPTHDHSGAHQ